MVGKAEVPYLSILEMVVEGVVEELPELGGPIGDLEGAAGLLPVDLEAIEDQKGAGLDILHPLEYVV